MKIGIVGSEAAKFTRLTEYAARREIQRLIGGASLVISGHSPLGGIDWWAIDEATRIRAQTREYAPTSMRWAGPDGFQARNLKIARESDKVVCITLQQLPPHYTGMRFPGGCYHCGTPSSDHVKSGGCWTMHRAYLLGKPTELVVIAPDGQASSRVSDKNWRVSLTERLF